MAPQPVAVGGERTLQDLQSANGHRASRQPREHFAPPGETSLVLGGREQPDCSHTHGYRGGQ
jgi:hypothetical protein